MEVVDKLLNSIDTRDAGEVFSRHTVIALTSKFGGTFELRRPDWQGHCEPAIEDFVLCAQDAAYKEQQVQPLIYTCYTQEQLLVLAKNYPYALLSPKGLLFLLTAVRGSAYEPSRHGPQLELVKQPIRAVGLSLQDRAVQLELNVRARRRRNIGVRSGS